ncbi:HNH endonuclease [Arthrobacter phage Kaylissa]|uniref:HNH endonuclease n=1 Tax=Arthrobacter phage Kaylissa TaxID=2835951 RepID=A0AA92N6A6_9CAUD|nr:endonuclease VII [Arthrobacter phage Kaylissa]QXO14575.1 HNH endonuclease [Arthrobacter phage Kaylissa]
MPTETKICARCKEEKPLDAFYTRSDNGKPHANCKPCHAARQRELYAESPERRAKIAERLASDRHKQRKAELLYGMDPGDYARLLAEQGGTCSICHQPPSGHRLCVDHDHTSGKVRGLLCHNCNRAIGLLGDDPERVASAAAYLERTK